MDTTTKRCSGCGVEKSIDEFYFRDRARSQRQNYCRACKSRYNRAWYRRNREKHIDDVRRNNARYRAAARAYVNGLKRGPCADCGVRLPPVAMDFDHVDPSAKSRDISRMVRFGASIGALAREIEKCDLVCSNCHRLRTEERRRGASEHTDDRALASSRPPPRRGPRQLKLL